MKCVQLTRKPRMLTLRGSTVAHGLVPLDLALVEALHEGLESSILKCLLKAIGGRLPSLPQYHLRPSLDSLFRPVVQVSTVDSSSSHSIPTIYDAPDGPALCSTVTECELAVSRLVARLRRYTHLSCAVDLEGDLPSQIHLLQISVRGLSGATDVAQRSSSDQSLLCYVLDIVQAPGVLQRRGEDSLRWILENTNIIKSMHCCRGDTAALYGEFDIRAAGVFDTGVADCILRSVRLNKPRGLGKVLKENLGDVVQLSHKDTMVFWPGKFRRRPLSHTDYLYSAEDVWWSNELFESQREQLQGLQLLHLAFAISNHRLPHFFLTTDLAVYTPPTKAALVIVDATQFICVYDSVAQVGFVPWLCLTEEEAGHPDGFRRCAQRAHRYWCGPPPKGLASAVLNGARKVIRIGLCILFVATVRDCGEAAIRLNSAFQSLAMASTHHLMLRPRDQPLEENTVIERQQAVVQFLRYDSACNRQAKAALSITEDVTARSDSRQVGVSVVLGPSVLQERGSAIVHDGKRVYCIQGRQSGSAWHLPSYQLELSGTADDAAIRAFDMFAGAALRKRDDCDLARHFPALAPGFSKALNRAVDERQHVCKLGSDKLASSYYSIKLRGVSLSDYASLLYAAQLKCNGFRQLETDRKKNGPFRYATYEEARKNLNKQDAEAIRVMFESTAEAGEGAASANMVEPTRQSRQGDQPEEGLETGQAEPERQSRQGDLPGRARSGRQSRQGDLPAEGVDPEFDAMFFALTVIRFDNILQALEAGPGSADVAVVAAGAQAENGADQYEGVGLPPRTPALTSKEIIGAQMAHPATRQFIDYLTTPEEDRQPFEGARAKRELEYLFLEEGILCRRVPGKSERAVVIPPVLQRRVCLDCHDRCGHPGVSKVQHRVESRYYWDPPAMRAGIREHVKDCRVCVMTNMPRHKAGTHHSIPTGEWPFDVTSADTADTGCKRADGSKIEAIAFGCNLSRGILSEVPPVSPTAEIVTKALVKTVIRIFGVPRVFFSDAGSVYVAKVIKLLFKLFGITVRSSASYHHRSVGLVERWHSTMKRMLLALRKAKKNIDVELAIYWLNIAFNSAIHTITGFSPSFMWTLRQVRLPIDILFGNPGSLRNLSEWARQAVEAAGVAYQAANERLYMQSLNSAKKLDLRRDVHQGFELGDSVIVVKGSVLDGIHPKADMPTTGPYTVAEKLGQDTYRVTGIKTPIHVQRLLRWPARRVESDNLYPVKAVTGHRLTERADRALGRRDGEYEVLEYRVHWQGFTSAYCSWRSTPYLSNIPQLVDVYNRQNDIPARYLVADLVPTDPTAPVVLPPPSAAARSTPHFRRRHPQVPPSGLDSVAEQGASAAPQLVSELDELPQIYGPAVEPAPLVAARALSSNLWRVTSRELYRHCLAEGPLAARLSKKGKWTFAKVFRKAAGLQVRWTAEKQMQEANTSPALLEELKEIAELERLQPGEPLEEAPPSPPPSPPSSPSSPNPTPALPGSRAPCSLQMERDGATRALVAPCVSTAPGYPRDFVSPVLRAYFDPRAGEGLQRGVCYSSEARQATFCGPVLRNVCGGVVRPEDEYLSELQRTYTIGIPQSGHLICWHPAESACSLFNEDTAQPANHVFQTLDIFLPARAQSSRMCDLRGGDLHFCIMLVVQVAPVDRTTGLATIYYGPDYRRGYGEPCGPVKAGHPVGEDVVWSLLADQGVTGEAAIEALLLRGAPLDEETTRVASRLRRRLGVKAAITSASVLATAHSRSPLPVVVLGGEAPESTSLAGRVLPHEPSGPEDARGCTANDAIVVSDADSEPGDSAENPLCLSGSPPASPPSSDFVLDIRHCCICPTLLESTSFEDRSSTSPAGYGATPPPSPPTEGPASGTRLTLALDSHERDQVWQQATRQNWRALQSAGVGYCTDCFAQCLVTHLGWRQDSVGKAWTDVNAGLVFTNTDVARLYQFLLDLSEEDWAEYVAAGSVFTDVAVARQFQWDPFRCASFSAACSRCQGRVLPLTALPVATPGCDVQLEHRLLLLWCHRDQCLQGRAWRLWRVQRAWRRLLVVVLAANRLERGWLDSNACRYAPGGEGQRQAGRSFLTESARLVLGEAEGDPCVHDWVDICRYAPPRCLAAWCTMPGCGALMECSCRILRPRRTSTARVAGVPLSLSDSTDSSLAEQAAVLRGSPTTRRETRMGVATYTPRQCICGEHGGQCVNQTEPGGVGQRRFLCAQCIPPCGCLCSGCGRHDYTSDVVSDPGHSTQAPPAGRSSPPGSERRVGLLGGSDPLYSNGKPYRGGVPRLGPLSAHDQRKLDDNYLEADDRSECWVCLEPLHAHQLALCGHRRHANILLDCCMCNAHPGPEGEHDLDDDDVRRRRPARQRDLFKVYRDLGSDLRKTSARHSSRRQVGVRFDGLQLVGAITEQAPSPPPSPPIAGFTSVVCYAPASVEAQAALHRHLSDGVPLLVSPPLVWSQRSLCGLSERWVAFLESWDASNGPKVVPSGFPDNPYHGFGFKWLTYWRMNTSWFVAAVKGSDLNMVEQWVAKCDSPQAAMVGEVISALGGLLLPGRHDPTLSLQPFFAHAGSPPVTADLHFDTYDNILWVIIGRKRVWLLDRASLPQCADRATGRWNERLDISPASHPGLLWVYSELGPGAMLLIPCGFWHYVLSDPNTLATNQWFYPRVVEHLLPPVVADGLQTLKVPGTRERRQTRWFSPSSSSS